MVPEEISGPGSKSRLNLSTRMKQPSAPRLFSRNRRRIVYYFLSALSGAVTAFCLIYFLNFPPWLVYLICLLWGIGFGFYVNWRRYR